MRLVNHSENAPIIGELEFEQLAFSWIVNSQIVIWRRVSVDSVGITCYKHFVLFVYFHVIYTGQGDSSTTDGLAFYGFLLLINC